MHRCPWCGGPCDCDEVEEPGRDCAHNCAKPDEDDDYDDEDE